MYRVILTREQLTRITTTMKDDIAEPINDLLNHCPDNTFTLGRKRDMIED